MTGVINKYEFGKIYKIFNTLNDDVYVGSTYQSLSRRMSKHRNNAKDPNKNTTKFYAYANELGMGKFYIDLIEDYSCNNKEELRAREGYWIREIGTLNNKIAGRTSKQNYEDNKESRLEKTKECYANNKEARKQQQKEYRDKKKDVLAEKSKEYYEENKEAINNYKKEWYEKNKEAVLERVKKHAEEHREEKNEYYKERYQKKKAELSVKTACVCGGCYAVMSKSKHFKTKLHQTYEESVKTSN